MKTWSRIATIGLCLALPAGSIPANAQPAKAHAERPAAVPALPAVDKSAFTQALASYRKGDIADADAKAAAIRAPVARAILEWVAIRENGKALGFARIARFMHQHPGWPSEGLVRIRAEQALLDENLPHKDVKAFFAHHQPASAAGALAYALVLQAEGKDKEAAHLIRGAWHEKLMSEDVEAQIYARFKGILTQQDDRERMEFLLFRHQWDAALRAAAHAGKGYIALARARIAVIRKAHNAPAAIKAVPASLHQDSSYAFTRAVYLRTKKKYLEAAKAMSGISSKESVLVDGDEWWDERRILARNLLDEGHAKLAYRIVTGHGAESRTDRLEADFHAGWIALRFLHEPALAARHFAHAERYAATPISKARISYWQGRAAEAEKKVGEAKGFYEKAAQQSITYYGQIARVKLGLKGVPLRPAPSGTVGDIARLDLVEAIRILYALDQRDLLSPFYLTLAHRFDDGRHLAALADLARQHNDAKDMVIVGKIATQKGAPLDRTAFPTIGIPPFDLAGDSVEKPLIYAIARQESIFDAKVISRAGARGLMQLMPSTAKLTARQAGLDFSVARLTSDGAYNATLGTAYLRHLVNYWNGSYILTIASYNAGSGNVRKWIAAYGDPRKPGVDPVDWVERIPFSETRNYVQRVLENIQVYRHRLGIHSATLIDADLQRGLQSP